jgi:hypothetical protein
MPWHLPLLLAATADESIFIPLTLVSIFFLILVLFIVWLVRSLELRLILLGLLTALLAAWCAQFPGVEGTTLQAVTGHPARPGQPGEVGVTLRGGGAAEPLGKIAVLLVLGGLAVALLGWKNYPAAPAAREEGFHERRV